MRNISRKITLALFIITAISVSGQTLKSFKGPYADGKSPQGTATYKYYEDPETREFVKEGAFTYSFKGQNDYDGFQQTITGNYSKGLKHGTWTYKVNMVDCKIGSYYHTGTITLVSHYKNGYADGNWKETYNDKARKKYYQYGQYKWTDYEPTGKFTTSMNFKNGKIVGDVAITDDEFKAIGSYDENSFAIGTWKITLLDKNQNIEIIYKDKYMTELFGRNSSGQIIDGSMNYKEDFALFNKVKAMTLREKENQGLELDTFCGNQNVATKYIDDYFDKMMSNDWFMYKYIGGDKTYNTYQYTYGISGGCNIVLKKVNYSSLFDIADYRNAEQSYENGNYFSAVKYYDNFKKGLKSTYNTKRFKQSDLRELDLKIQNSLAKADSLSNIYMTRTKLDIYSDAVYRSKINYQTQIISKYISNYRYLGSYKLDYEFAKGKGWNLLALNYDKEILDYPLKEEFGELIQSFKSQDPVFFCRSHLGVFESFDNYIRYLDTVVENCFEGMQGFNRDYIVNGKGDIQYYCPCIEDSLASKILAGNKYLEKAKQGLLLSQQFESKVKQIETLNIEKSSKRLYLTYVPFLKMFKEDYYKSKNLEDAILKLNEINQSLDKIIALYQGEIKPIDKELKSAISEEQQRAILFK